MKVELRDEVLGDLAEIRGWYDERNPAVARAFMARVQARLEQLAQFPEMAPTEPDRLERTLMVDRAPLVIVYRIDPVANVIDVIAIVDARRHPSVRSHP